MKKTLIALMALAGIACGAETPALTLTTITADQAYDLSQYITGTDFTVAVTLDYATIKAKLALNNNNNVNYQLINAGEEGEMIGLTVCYGNGSAIQGTMNGATWLQDSCNGHAVGMGLNSFDDLSWSTGSKASLVMTYSATDGISGVFTITDASGTVLNRLGGTFHTCNVLKPSDDFSVDMVKFDGMVTSAEVYNTAMTAAEMKKLGAMIIPEPATATLSLLALAGLCARRRRA